jgi:hypothetical protein
MEIISHMLVELYRIPLNREGYEDTIRVAWVVEDSIPGDSALPNEGVMLGEVDVVEGWYC